MSLKEINLTLKEILALYSPNRGFRVWKRINPDIDWCYKIVSDCRFEDKKDYEEYLDRKVERIDIVDNFLEIITEQIGENEYYSSEEKREIFFGK